MPNIVGSSPIVYYDSVRQVRERGARRQWIRDLVALFLLRIFAP